MFDIGRWGAGIGVMNREEQECRILLSSNIKRFRGRIGLSQMDLALQLGISTTFLSDIETGKNWVSAKTLSVIAKALKIEVFELFKPAETANLDVSRAVMKYLDDIDGTVVKAMEDSISPAVQKSVKMVEKSLKKVREYYKTAE
jgi:transcriptional regulator with XRE-family HTH domain